MKRKVYYTVDLDNEEVDYEMFELTGNKTIYIYEIKDNEMVKINTIGASLTDNSEEIIREVFKEELTLINL